MIQRVGLQACKGERVRRDEIGGVKRLRVGWMFDGVLKQAVRRDIGGPLNGEFICAAVGFGDKGIRCYLDRRASSTTRAFFFHDRAREIIC